MCGIVGLINHKPNGLSKDDENIFKRLLYIGVERGPDSTGVFSVANDGTTDILKEAVPSFSFMEREPVKDLLKKAYTCSTFLVGHNRRATQGKVTDENAHPFVDGNIVLVHNGSLWNHRSVEQVDVDSHAIAISLNKSENDVEQVFNKLKGPAACVWYNNTNKSLNFFRNKERPLFFYNAGSATFFASEWLMLYYALLKEGVKWDNEKCTPLEVHKHIQFFKKADGGASKISDDVDIKIEESSPVFTQDQGQTGRVDTQTTGNINNAGAVSLQARKKMRNQFNNFVQKNKKNSIISFVPEDYSGAAGSWVILGSIKNAPQHIQGCTILDGFKEEDVLEMCSQDGGLVLDAEIEDWVVDHKKMIFQLNVKLLPKKQTTLVNKQVH